LAYTETAAVVAFRRGPVWSRGARGRERLQQILGDVGTAGKEP
jgi:hypothetical protein